MKRLAIAAALLTCVLTSTADAATLVNSHGRLTYTASGAAPIGVSFSYGGKYALDVIPQSFSDRDPVTSVTGCATVYASFTYYTCDGVDGVTVIGGSGDDVIYAGGLDVPLIADMGAGDDYVQNGEAADVLAGGAGDDSLTGATGDAVGGGPGVDFASYTPPAGQVGAVNLTLDGVADDGVAGDGANFLADLENVDADARYEFDDPLPAYGPVTLVGTAAGNELTGSSGADTITGGGGIDVLSGEAGDDTLLARDGLADRVRCGAGTDTALVDPFDVVSDTCESVVVAGERTPDDAPPRIAWRGGSALGIDATDDHGIASVQWLDDDRVICTDTAPPFDCDFRPRIEDVGANMFTAIATDSAGQTSSVSLTRTIARFTPTAVSLRVTRRLVASGKVTLPAGVPCSGTVTVAKRTAKLRPNCSFRVVVPRAKTYTASYLGTDAIAPRRSKAVKAS